MHGHGPRGSRRLAVFLRCKRSQLAHRDTSRRCSKRSLSGCAIKRTLSAGFGAVAARFSDSEEVCRTHSLRHTSSCFFRPCHTAHRIPVPSTTSGTAARKSPSSNPQRLKAFRQEFSLSIMGATENLRSSFKLTLPICRFSAPAKPPCLDSGFPPAFPKARVRGECLSSHKRQAGRNTP